MKSLSVALLVALAAGPITAQAGDEPTPLPQTTDRLNTPSLVFTPQSVRRQVPTPIADSARRSLKRVDRHGRLRGPR
jgi:hypothetical protein